MIKKISGR